MIFNKIYMEVLKFDDFQIGKFSKKPQRTPAKITSYTVHDCM